MNKVILCGRTTKTPEFKDGEHPYVRFSLAVDRRKEGTDFINCAAFGKTAESIYKWVGKGIKILVDGRLQVSTYGNDGEKKTSVNVIVDMWEFAQSKETNDEGFMKANTLAEDELPWN